MPMKNANVKCVERDFNFKLFMKKEKNQEFIVQQNAEINLKKNQKCGRLKIVLNVAKSLNQKSMKIKNIAASNVMEMRKNL